MAMRIQARRARIMKQEMKDSRSETRCPWHTSKTVCCRPALFDLNGLFWARVSFVADTVHQMEATSPSITHHCTKSGGVLC